jgi:Nif-specific regulatory protein
VTDFQMPEKNGLEVLKRSKMINEGTVGLVMTAYGTVESAVEAMKAGAYDYVLKPFDLEEMELKVERAVEHRRLLARIEAYDRTEIVPRFENIVGESPQMKEVFRTIEKVARSNATVLILGETGVGKELVAEALHRNSSRSDRPFVKMNCAALHESLLESELFGHERGAFTGADRQRTGRFELANEGTLFLDEIGNMTPSTQTKVLRVLQEREFERLGGSRTVKVDVRLVAATNKNLEEAIHRGEFREDLYYRLNVVNVSVPPLRERKEDIVPLASHFIDRFAKELKKDVRGLEPAAVRALKRHTWPGNIRELENTIERAVLMCDGEVIHGHHLPPSLQTAEASGTVTRVSLEDAVGAYEKDLIQDALKTTRGNRAKAARLLDTTERIINYKVRNYGIDARRFKS